MNTEQFENKIKEIENDVIHGAIYLTIEMLHALLKEAERREDGFPNFLQLLKQLEKLHPAMTSIENSLSNIAENIGCCEFKKENVLRVVSEEISEVKEREKNTIENLCSELENYQSIMTISSSSTILNALEKIHSKTRIKSIYILESRPLFEGRLTANSLAKLGYEVKIIVDAAAAYYSKNIDAIVIGADTVFQDGSVINKIGSMNLALLAKYYKIPFFVAASKNKFSKNLPDKLFEYIEEKPEVDIWSEAPTAVSKLNVFFELVPFNLITKIISD